MYFGNGDLIKEINFEPGLVLYNQKHTGTWEELLSSNEIKIFQIHSTDGGYISMSVFSVKDKKLVEENLMLSPSEAKALIEKGD